MHSACIASSFPPGGCPDAPDAAADAEPADPAAHEQSGGASGDHADTAGLAHQDDHAPQDLGPKFVCDLLVFVTMS